MPDGTRSTGRQRPTTPGSITPLVDRTATPAGIGRLDTVHAELARTAVRICRHVRNRTTAIAMVPATQTTKMAGANQPMLRGASCTDRNPTVGSATNGRLTWASVAETAGVAICGALDAHSSRSPSAISSVNGTKNLTDAANHSQ